MESDDRYQVWANDADVLAEIGRYLFVQPTRISVRLPKAVAEQAVASWEREDDGARPLPEETLEQKTVRHRAGALGLIGLSIQERGTTEGDEVVVEIDAWEVGTAFEAADEAGLLDGLSPPQT